MEIAEKLRTARKALKLTLEMASERSGIGISTISEFENGRREPRLGQLQQLARTYHRSVSSLLDQEYVPGDVVLWSQRPESPMAEELQATFVELADQYRTLEVLCGQPFDLNLPLIGLAREALNPSTAASLARRVRNELGLGDRPGQSLLRVLDEVCNIKVFHLAFEPSESAACALSDQFGAAVLLNSNNLRWRRNFDLARALFFLLTWRVFRCDFVGPTDQPSLREDEFATCFARNVLMPEEVFREAVDAIQPGSPRIDFDGLFEVARVFDVSIEAVVWQMGFVFNLPADKLQATLAALPAQAATGDIRPLDSPPRRPTRFDALARQALRRGLIATGRYAEYVSVSRREAMTICEQDANQNVQVEVTHP